MCGCACVMVLLRSKLLSPSTMWVQGVRLQLSAFAPSTVTCSVILLVPLCCLSENGLGNLYHDEIRCRMHVASYLFYWDSSRTWLPCPFVSHLETLGTSETIKSQIPGSYLCCSAWYNSLDPSHPSRWIVAGLVPQPLGQQEHLQATQTWGHSSCSQLQATKISKICRVWVMGRVRGRVKLVRVNSCRVRYKV